VRPLRRLRTNQRGGGAAVAVALIMSMILVVALVQNVYIWGQTLTAEEMDRVNETIIINEIYTINSSTLVVEVKNIGSVDAHLIAVWIEPVEAPNATQRLTINEYVSIERTKNIILTTSQLNDTNFSEDHLYTVVTERGNFASRTFPQTTSYTLPEIYYLGVFGVDWFYCKYSSEQNPPNGSLLSDAAYIFKSDDYVAFYLNVTNFWDFPCAITSDSFLALTTVAPPQGEPIFHVVQNVTYDGTPTITMYDDSTPYILGPNESQILTFASESQEESAWQWGKGYPFGSETTTDGSDIQICLFYEVYEDEVTPTGQYYGQTISTHAVILLAK
jgi:hypothetical protein